MVNEIERCHLDCFKVWRYRGHILSLLSLRRSLSSRCLWSRPHVRLVASRTVFDAETPCERRTFLIRSITKVTRSDRQRLVLSNSPVDQVSQAFQCASSLTWHECTQTSMLSPVQNGTTMVRNFHRPPPLVAPGSNHSCPDRSHGNPMERAK